MTTERRRSQRLILSVPILVSGESSTGQFSDETQTLVVNAHGALITLATPVSPEQRLTLKRRASGEEEACRVVYIGSSPEDKAKLGVEFVKPAPHFWHLAFPPKDWTPESVASEPDDSVKAPSVLPQGEVACEIDTERRRTTRYNFGAIAEVIAPVGRSGPRLPGRSAPRFGAQRPPRYRSRSSAALLRAQTPEGLELS